MADLGEFVDELLASLPNPAPGLGAGEPFAAVVGTYLAQAAAQRVPQTLQTLRDAGLLDPQELARAAPGDIAEVLRLAGVANAARHAGPLRRLAEWWQRSGEAIAETDTESLRDQLLALRGIGPATADAIVLFGLGRPTYPVDRATDRVFVRHGWIDPTADYDEARAVAQRLGSDDPSRLAHLSAGLDRIGAEFCRVAVVRCDRCPLRPWLPEGGPREPV